MKKHQFKALVREIIRGIVSERNKENKAKKDAWVRQVGQNVHPYLKNVQRSAIKGQSHPRGLAGGMPAVRAATGQSTPQQNATPGKTQPASGAPQDVQAKVAQGGKVVFGKYFDSAGTYLGSMKQGKWTPAGQQGQNPQEALKESKTLSLRVMLMENAYNRVNLMKIGALVEKALPELTKDQSKTLTKLFTELSMMATNMNTLPYTVKEYKLNEWQLLIASFHKKLDEFRSEVMKINEKSDKVNCAPLIKALDEVLTY